MILGAVFKKSNLSFYKVISEPGTYIVKSGSSVTSKNLIDEGSKSRYLVNLRVATEESILDCLDYMGCKKEVPFKEVSEYFITGAIWSDSIENEIDLPTKGESVIATFDYVDNVLRCTSITLIPRKSLHNFDLEGYELSKSLLTKILK